MPAAKPALATHGLEERRVPAPCPCSARCGLAGLLAPSAGDAYVGGLSVTRDAAALRGRLGVCPQFDVLWPDLSVEQHLRLFAAIKGYPRSGPPRAGGQRVDFGFGWAWKYAAAAGLSALQIAISSLHVWMCSIRLCGKHFLAALLAGLRRAPELRPA